jgi:hypothetical protein
LYYSPHIIRIIKNYKRGVERSTNGEMMNGFRVLAEKPEEKRQLEISWLRIL